MKVSKTGMTLKNPYKFIQRLFLDFLMLSAIGNALSIFMIPGDLWSLHVVFTNCLFSIGIGYPSWKGMSYIIVVLERKLPWLKYPIKRLVTQLLSMTLFSGLIIFLGIGAAAGWLAGTLMKVGGLSPIEIPVLNVPILGLHGRKGSGLFQSKAPRKSATRKALRILDLSGQKTECYCYC